MIYVTSDKLPTAMGIGDALVLREAQDTLRFDEAAEALAHVESMPDEATVRISTGGEAITIEKLREMAREVAS